MTRRTIAMAAGLAVLAVGGWAKAAAPQVGQEAPEIKLKTADGVEMKLASYRDAKRVLLAFLPNGSAYSARLVKRLDYDRKRLAEYDAEAVVIHPGAAPSKDFLRYGSGALTLYDADGSAYKAYGLPFGGEGKGAWAMFFIDRNGRILLDYHPWPRDKEPGRDHKDMLDIYEDIENSLNLHKTPEGAKVARFRQGVSPAGYDGCTGLQIWPRYTKGESLAGKETAFVRNWTAGEFVLIRFQGLFGEGQGQVAPKSRVAKAWLRLSTINHASTQKTYLHRMTTPWDSSARFQRSRVENGKDVPWKAPGLGEAGANFEAEPVSADFQVPVNYGDVRWDVTQVVQRWADGEPNYGLAILAEKGMDTPDHACFAMETFGWKGLRPELTIYYHPPEVSPDEANADALMQAARSAMKLRMRQMAQQRLQEIVDKYPDTNAAKQAREMLKDFQ